VQASFWFNEIQPIRQTGGEVNVDDHDMARNGLAVPLEAFENLDLIGAAGSSQRAKNPTGPNGHVA